MDKKALTLSAFFIASLGAMGSEEERGSNKLGGTEISNKSILISENYVKIRLQFCPDYTSFKRQAIFIPKK